jgi:hypothetical protein
MITGEANYPAKWRSLRLNKRLLDLAQQPAVMVYLVNHATLPDGTRRLLRGSNVIIGTGTRAALEPIPGLAEAQPLTHIEAVASGFTEKGVLAMNSVRHVKTERSSRTEGKTATFIDGERPTDSPEFNKGRPTI